jgi:hypothetical protein
MAETIIAHPAHESTDQSSDLEHAGPIAERVLRGQRLFEDHGNDFVYRQGAWIIASDTVPGRAYEVRLGPVERCECADHTHRGVACKHIFSARIAQSKSHVCSCCGSRVLGRFVTEVQEEDELLSWFVGDLICSACISEGFWA